MVSHELADENCPSILSPYPSSSLPDCCIVKEHDCCIPNLWSVPQWSESSSPGRHKWPRTQHLCLPILCHCRSYISHVLYILYAPGIIYCMYIKCFSPTLLLLFDRKSTLRVRPATVTSGELSSQNLIRGSFLD